VSGIGSLMAVVLARPIRTHEFCCSSTVRVASSCKSSTTAGDLKNRYSHSALL